MAFITTNRWSKGCQRKRDRRGNVIVFMTAISCTFLLAFVLFALSFTRLIGTNPEQKSGIEAASLAAAKDLSRIVIEDPNFGFIGLSDSAPIGPHTLAQDGYYLQVHSINSIFATIRLDMIIASELNDPVMMQFAQRDYTNARQAARDLVAVLEQSLLPGASSGGSMASASSTNNDSSGSGGSSGGGNSGSGQNQPVDAYGNPVLTYNDAVAAYQANQVRMAGQSEYVEGSMRLTLGSLERGGPTNTPTPQPNTYAHADAPLSCDGKYMSYVNIPFNNTDFVFAGVGEAIKLVDSKRFLTSDPSLPYSVTTIVRAEADQRLLQTPDASGHVVHAAACAQPASTVDPVPAPGKLTISFPNKKIARLGKPADLINEPDLNSPPVIITTPIGGDIPGSGTNAPATWPIPGTPTLGRVFSGGLYDWIRRGGAKVRVDAMKAMLNQPFLGGSTGGGVMQAYEFSPDGTILLTLRQRANNPKLQESEKQLSASVGTYSAIDSTGVVSTFKVKAINFVRNPGRINGGKHAGEPLLDATLDATILAQSHITGTLLTENPSDKNLAIAQCLELGSGGVGCGGGGGDCDGGGNRGGGDCGGGNGGRSGDCGGGSGSGSGSNGGNCGGGDGSGSTGDYYVYFSQGPGSGAGAVRNTYRRNGRVADFEFKLVGGGSGQPTDGAASAAQ